MAITKDTCAEIEDKIDQVSYGYRLVVALAIGSVAEGLSYLVHGLYTLEQILDPNGVLKL